MLTHHWKTISSKLKESNPYFDVIRDKVTLPTNEVIDYYYIREPNSVMIIPFISSGEFILLRQYRYLANSMSWEFPCGSIKIGETVEDAAMRELEEESGYRSNKIAELTTVHVSTGTSIEKMHLLTAENLVKTNQCLERTEQGTEVHIFNRKMANELIQNNSILCSQTLICLLYLIHRI